MLGVGFLITVIDVDTRVHDSSILRDPLDFVMCHEEPCVGTIVETSEYLGEAAKFVSHGKDTSFLCFIVCDELLVRLWLALFVEDSIGEVPWLLHKKICTLE